MAHVSLSFLGSFRVTLDGQPVMGFKSNKERALLTYLAVEAHRPHRREVLAGLLWPDWPDRDALSNLRYALSNLRQAIGDRTAEPPFLLITRDSLRFNLASNYSLDVKVLTEATVATAPPPSIEELQRAVALYQGSFLEGFSVSDSAGFEEWVLFTRERLARMISAALRQLTEACEQRGEFERAQTWAWRQIELEPWDENAHQRVMRLLALSGKRGAALAQYEACRRQLAEELGVEPAVETTRLYEQIRDGKLKTPAPPAAPPPESGVSLPRFLEETPTLVQAPVFVARERELAQLDRFLDLALAGQGRVVFVTGEAGSGKSALVQEFGRRVQQAHADLIVVSSNCNAYTGIGDPYLPFREILGLLTGDVEARWAASTMTSEHARRLWGALPTAAQALAEVGPDLVETFIPRAPLLERALACAELPGKASWLRSLEGLVGKKPVTAPGASSLQQSDLFEQYTRVLQAMTKRAPLLLVLDDLQWADVGSISLLFHLGRRLRQSRILILGAYRAEEVALGREGRRHPLDPVVNEFQRDFGQVVVSLDPTESRDFVEAILDSEPNRLGTEFREMLYRQTGGHPLFTVELLRGLQERGDLVQDAEGRWLEQRVLDWEQLPARVEAVIAERIARLAEPLQAALRVASVEGDLFTGEIVARLRGVDEREMLACLSHELDRKHRLIRAQSIARVDGERLSRYRFRHIFFQRYLYGTLDTVERTLLHEEVGTALEQLYGAHDQAETIAVQLALHFQKAMITKKAIHYLHQAGDRAVQLSAYEEGIAQLSRGLELLMTLSDSPERAQQELGLQLSLGMAWLWNTRGLEFRNAYLRARELCQQTGETSQLWRILTGLSIFHYVRAEHQVARELAEEALRLAQCSGDPVVVALCDWHLGFILFTLGEYTASRTHLEQVIAFYKPEQHHRSFVLLRGSDVGVSALAYHVCCLWCLGYPEQALIRSQAVLALARGLGHPFSMADVLCYAGCLLNELRRDAQALKGYSDELTRLLGEERFPSWLGSEASYQGEALAMLGQVEEAIALMRKGMAAKDSSGARVNLTGTLCALAEAQAKAGQPGEGLSSLAQALDLVQETDERYYEAELHRVRGELLRTRHAPGDEAEAEAAFHKAVEVARRQQAKSWELRATVSLCRLQQQQGRGAQARQALAKIYGCFTEGFDTADLREARDLLEELPAQSSDGANSAAVSASVSDKQKATR
jgi:DNA-binding SARP family transcriptional activator/predicted ATPase